MSEVYVFRLNDSSDFNGTPGGRIDVNSAGNEDSWFICSSQTYSGVSPAIASIYLYNMLITEKVYTSSRRYVYDHWGKCLTSYAISSSEGWFAIMDVSESSSPTSPITKFMNIDFNSGAITIQKQIT